MANDGEPDGVTTLVSQTAGMAELAIAVGHADQRHNEYLLYPDNNFDETIDTRYVRGQKYTFEHIFLKTGEAFVPGVPVYVTSITAERTAGGLAELLNPYRYKISVTHGPYEWTVRRRYKHFHEMHKALVRYVRAQLKGPATVVERARGESGDYPCFPTRKDRVALIDDSTVHERCKFLMNYLNKILRHPKFRRHRATREFLATSSFSFVHGLSASRKEGNILKRRHDEYQGVFTRVNCPLWCYYYTSGFHRHWFVVKDTYVICIQNERNEVHFPMLVDRGYQVTTDLKSLPSINVVKIKNLQRTLTVKCKNRRIRDEWLRFLLNVSTKAECFLGLTQYSRFDSYAPVREGQLAYWFVNGKSYMEAVAKALLRAKEEVFITDWWLSPEVMLIRPADDEEFRLDNILGKIADSGVRVYVMVFKELKRVVNLNSLYTKQALVSKSRKGFIKVLRHPNHNPNHGIFLWSHHEKMVVIDQKVAFVGGIDLCYGRWDDDYMRLTDLGEDNDRRLKSASELEAEKTAALKMETIQRLVPKINRPFVDPNTTGRSSMNSTLGATNEAYADTSLDASQFENGKSFQMKPVTKAWLTAKSLDHAASPEDKELNYDELLSIQKLTEDDNEAARDPKAHVRRWQDLVRKMRLYERQNSDDEEVPEESRCIPGLPSHIDRQHRYFIGKDYANAYIKDFEELNEPNEDFINRTTVPRMPWHDEALVVFGTAARDVARHFIQRWNIHKCEKYIDNDNYPYLLPRSYEDDDELNVADWQSFLNHSPFRVNTQCVRSVGPWSIGTRFVEASIHNAYLQLIGAAKHYIYIENQFFISINGDSEVRNQIGDALFHRIKQADMERQKFRVYVVLPLLPGFDSRNAVHAVLYYVMCSIAKNKNSLFARLRAAGVTPENYISFFGMRNYDVLMGKLVTEIIYVHSKLMIVDDQAAICGSANINDRSLLGHRDSEFCMVIEDCEKEYGRFNGEECLVGKFCSSWRKKIFAMLLGIHIENPHNIDLTDPVSDELYTYIRDVARKNTLIYEETFNDVPTDRTKNFKELDTYSSAPKLISTDPEQALEKLKGIQGFIVEYPIYFLDDENYLPAQKTREGVAPTVTWT